MSNNNFTEFQKKFNISDTLTANIDMFFERLVEHGYISIFKKKLYIQKLYNNILEIYVGSNNRYDYKTGFYDASKKILYIKDEKDIPSLFLRLLYVITTRNIDNDAYISGYMITKLSTKNYKLIHENFGINRAVMANLVCTLCNELPDNIKLLPSYHNYTHNFLGYKIVANNDIYSLEGKILKELCFALNIDENIFYVGIFNTNSLKYLDNILSKKDFALKDKFFKLYDELSRKYSNYCKLSYLSKELNKNYLELKKTILDDNTTKDLDFQKKCIETEIKKVLYQLQKNEEDATASEDDFVIEDTSASLNETLTNFEGELVNTLVTMQSILAKKVLTKPNYLSYYEYASKLTQFNNILILPNKDIKKAITHTILYDLLPKDELTTVNLTVKIKYSLITSILNQSQYTNISKLINFSIIESLAFAKEGTILALIMINGMFSKLVQMCDLNERLEKMQTPPEFIPLDNLGHVINSDYTNMYVGNFEKIYTALKFKYPELSTLSLNDMYAFEYLNQKYLIAIVNGVCHVLHYAIFADTIEFTPLTLTENYSLFDDNKNIDIKIKSNLPVLAKRKK